jgi:ankyrin repeat protein
LERGADSAAQGNDGPIPLHAASESGHVDLAQLRVAQSAVMPAQDKHWLTPLHGASESRHDDLMRFRVEDGADMTAKRMEGLGPLNPDLVESEGGHGNLVNLGKSIDHSERDADVTS